MVFFFIHTFKKEWKKSRKRKNPRARSARDFSNFSREMYVSFILTTFCNDKINNSFIIKTRQIKIMKKLLLPLRNVAKNKRKGFWFHNAILLSKYVFSIIFGSTMLWRLCTIFGHFCSVCVTEKNVKIHSSRISESSFKPSRNANNF